MSLHAALSRLVDSYVFVLLLFKAEVTYSVTFLFHRAPKDPLQLSIYYQRLYLGLPSSIRNIKIVTKKL